MLNGDIAPADDRSLIVDGKRFVVHAPVQPEEVEKVINRARFTNQKRIEQPNFDVRVRIERSESRVDSGRAVIIQQKANSDAAIGGIAALIMPSTE